MSRNPKALGAALLPEFDTEMANTRRTLERIPGEVFGWKPHPKSFSMGELASHLAQIPGWGTITITEASFDTSPEGKPHSFQHATSVQEALAQFDQGVHEARVALMAATDEQLLESWSLLANGKALFTMPKVAVMRTFVMNHLIHHRAQLGVYLRLNDVPVPAIYGPSADESGA